ncbi:putative reverse transcriptase domain-containing protein [Tanacetum coccineum]
MDASDLAHGEVMSLRTTILGQMSEIRELHAADRRRQAVISKMLKADQRRSSEMRELKTADHTRQQDRLPHYRDSKDPLKVLHSQSCQRKLVAVHRLDHVMKMAPKRATRSTTVITTPTPTATTTTSVTNAQLQAMIDQGVTAALAARNANRNGDDSHTSGMGGRRTERIVQEYTYQDLMKCKPLYFKGTEGVVELIQWFERMEIVFRISNCSMENHIKFSTCTLLAGALTWWNSYVLTVSYDVAYAMTWANLRKKMTDKYYLRNEMKKLKAELWNLKVKGTDVIGYVSGLPDMIHGNIVASKPKTMQEAVEMATELMDKKVITIVERQAKNKRNHFACDYTSVGIANNANNQRGTRSGQKPTYFECGVQGHFKRECPKLKNNKNRGNQVGNDRAPAKVYVGDGSNRGYEGRLHIISYYKTQEYMLKGCPVFLAHVSTKEVEDKSEKKRLEDVPIV